MWNIDGILVFKLFKFFFWFLYFIINKLLYKECIYKENMSFVGLWFGSLKLIMLIFF